MRPDSALQGSGSRRIPRPISGSPMSTRICQPTLRPLAMTTKLLLRGTELRCEIVDHLYRYGPKTIMAIIEELSRLRGTRLRRQNHLRCTAVKSQASEPEHLPRHRRALEDGVTLRHSVALRHGVTPRPARRCFDLSGLRCHDSLDAARPARGLQPSQQCGQRPACTYRRSGVGQRSHEDHLGSYRVSRCRVTGCCWCATAFQARITLGVASRRMADTTPGLTHSPP